LAADYPILNVVTVPEVITLATSPFPARRLVVEALRNFPHFDDVAAEKENQLCD
jgi:hypothetical protein